MKNLVIKDIEDGVYITPLINFDFETGVCVISGEAYVENATKFFTPVIKWLETFCLEEKDRELTLVVRLSYYNTSASKILYKIILLIKDHIESGGKAIVKWYYNENEPECLGDIEDIAAYSGLGIEIIPE